MTNTTDGGPELHTLRLFGVLQRFGIVYLAVSSLSIFMTHRHPIHCQVLTTVVTFKINNSGKITNNIRAF